MSAATTNGHPQRKQLSQQLDRLDGILDVLAEALPGAAADACKEGARLAVRDALAELLAGPDLRALAAGLAAARTPPPARATVWDRIKGYLATARRAAADAVAAVAARGRAAVSPVAARGRAAVSPVAARGRAAVSPVAARCRAVVAAARAAARVLSAGLPVARFAAVGVAVGLAAALACYACPHGVAAAAGGAGAGVVAVAAQVGRWARRSAAALGLVGER